MNNSLEFRKDINGLRAIAVIAVLLYHFDVPLVKGGFIGVDIFFVISGYLITRIVLQELEGKSFSFVNFYLNRLFRLLPALMVVTSTLLVFGYFYLSSADYSVLSGHTFSTLFFHSNFDYLNEHGYFDLPSKEKWLLHSWSLSVELQFYLVYPILLAFAYKLLGYGRLKIVALGFTILSFSLLFFSKDNSMVAFYSLPYRGWEFLIGAMAFLYSNLFSDKKILGYIGILILFVSMFFIDANSGWPNFYTLVPVLATGIIIAVNNTKDSIIANNSIAQFLGACSYSIYLWHWPVVVAMGYFSVSSNVLYGFLLSILLGVGSYYSIEKLPFKKMGRIKYLVFILLVVQVIYAGVMAGGDYDTVYDKNYKQISVSARKALNDWNYPIWNANVNGIDVRLIDNKEEKNILFIGASHVEQTYPYVLASNANFNVYYLTLGGCSPAPSSVHDRWSCENVMNYRKLLEAVDFDKIVYSLYCLYCAMPPGGELQRISEIESVLYDFTVEAEDVYMLLGEPEGKAFDPREWLKPKSFLTDYVLLSDMRNKYKDIYSARDRFSQTYPDIQIIDPLDSLCDENKCMSRSESGVFFYKDDSHMRPWYAKKVLIYLNPILEI